MIFTMNAPEMIMEKLNYPAVLGSCAYQLRWVFGHCEMLCACNTLMYSDYSRYDSGIISEEKKRQFHDEHFPIDLKNAYELGKRLVEMDDS